MKKIVVNSGFVPEGTIPYRGEYIYRVKAVREGAHGLGEGFPQPEFLDLELEGVGGIEGKLEKTRPITADNPLNCQIHKYYLRKTTSGCGTSAAGASSPTGRRWRPGPWRRSAAMTPRAT